MNKPWGQGRLFSLQWVMCHARPFGSCWWGKSLHPFAAAGNKPENSLGPAELATQAFFQLYMCAVCCFISGKIPGDFVPSTRLARALWSSTSSWSSANSQHCPWVIQEGTARASPGHQRFCQHSYLSFMQPCALAHELSVFEPIFTHGAYRDSQWAFWARVEL